MKKILSLVIALVLTLAAVSALAAAPSKTNPDLVKVISEYFELSDKTYAGQDKITAELAEKGADPKNLPEDAQKAIPEGKEPKSVDEIIVLKYKDGITQDDIKEYPVIIKLQFGTDYAGKEVILLVGALDENGEPADWMSQVSVGNDDGTIDLVLQKEDVEWLAGRDFMVLVLE
jgi:ABC-type glycerol-3-phosphate transport system substrate-binding protein